MNCRTWRIVLIVFLICPASSSRIARGGDDTAELRSDVERLQTELNSLAETAERHERSLAEVRDIAQQLPRHRETLQAMKNRLKTMERIEHELKIWATASLVLGNQRTSNAAALQETESGYQIVATANHPFQKYAIAAAIQGKIPCRADAASTKLLEQLISEVPDRDTLPVLASEELSSRISQIVALRPVAEAGPQFMVFHDPVTGDQKVAVVQTSSVGSSVCTIDKSIEPFAKSLYTGGSVWIGEKDEIERHIEMGDPFVDYCALAILHSLDSVEHQRKNVCLAIKVELNSSTEDLASLGRHLHDEFYERLIRHGVPVLEREHEDDLRNEDLVPILASTDAHLAKATHTLAIDVDRIANGSDRVSVRLSDVTSSQSIWAANDSRSPVPNRNWKNYFLHNGVPSIVEFRSEFSRSRVQALLANEGLVTATPAKKLMLINEGRSGDSVRLRSLYGVRTIEVPAEDVMLTDIVSAPGQRVQADFENTTGKQILHYAAWRLARHVAPPAVRLPESFVSNSRRTWILPLGSSHNLPPDSRFRLLLPSHQSSAWSLFPSVAVLSEILDPSTSRIIVPGNQSLEVPELHDAIAVCDSWEHCKVAVMTPFVPIEPKTSQRKFTEKKSQGYSFGAAFQKSFMETLATRIDCTRGVWAYNPKVGPYWDEGIDRQKTLADLQKRGITHVMCGELESVTASRAEVHFGVMKLELGENGELVEGPVIDSVRILVARADL